MGKNRPKKRQTEKPQSVNDIDWTRVAYDLVKRGICPPTILDQTLANNRRKER